MLPYIITTLIAILSTLTVNALSEYFGQYVLRLVAWTFDPIMARLTRATSRVGKRVRSRPAAPALPAASRKRSGKSRKGKRHPHGRTTGRRQVR